MASVDDWSDGEIRSKLAELGTPVGPVTETTRKILIKKLKKLLQSSEGSAPSLGRTRRSLSRFSSGDEDSQEDAPSMPPPSRTRSLRRRTVGPTDISSMNDSASSSQRDSGISSNKTITKSSRKSTSAISSPPTEDFDSGSDSDVPVKTFESNISGRRSLKSTPAPLPRSVLSPDSTSAFGTSKPDTSSTRMFSSSTPTSELSSAPSRTYSNFRSETTTTSTRQYVVPRSDPVKPSLFSSTRSDLDRGTSTSGTSTYREVPISRTTVLPSAGPSSRSYEKISTDYRKTYREEEVDDEDDDQQETASTFQSDFLSRLQGKNRTSGGFKPLSTLSREEPSHVYSRSSISPSRSMGTSNLLLFDKYKNIDFGGYRSKISAATRDLFSRKNADYSERLYPGKASAASRFWNRTFVYIIIAAIMVLAAFSAYWFMGPYPLWLESDDNTYPICDPDNTTQPCIENKNLQPALNLLKIIEPKLHELAVDAYCNQQPGTDADVSEDPFLSETLAVEYLMKKIKPTPKSYNVETDLRCLKILIMANPHWNVKVVNEAGTDVEDAKAMVVTGGLAAQHVQYPVTCILYHFVCGIARWVVFTVSVFGILALGLYCYRFYKRRQEQHRRDVYSMVNKVLGMLANHYDQDKQGYLAVDNCRDELIPPMHRDSMKTVWDAAVDFIEKHESRVRSELHSVRGENVRVWRWLPAKGPPMSDTPKLDRLM